MRIPTFPRQSTADEAVTERTPVTARRDDSASTTSTLPPVRPTTAPVRPTTAPAGPTNAPVRTTSAPTEAERARAIAEPVAVPAAPAPKARTSFAATLGLILAVAGALLVLSGPLLGYGVGVSGLALVLSLAGVFGTRKRHVAGKSSALIGVLVSIAALVVGVLALAGQLWWLGTDVQTVPEFRTWLDTQFQNRI
ncbi:hypothetical protein [Actinoplanes derwentensis]|uniref:DUF4190 domain-containing protein n=1 Tax=Actinoplanes derwentensis TaxID=113562 RepID=A0A1H2D3L4_9ACTN|nr:hypothetical protein [Actinoplanes derwentensis]GID88279.1 hypothetical protein Ade03nite_72030 [Actinoplanes derwentensis]SDT77072.1 hypothetical protein SAMN04489716_7821 [Actinoplanes derwentensis]